MANRVVAVDLVLNAGRYQSEAVKAAGATRAIGDSATVAGARAQRGFDMAGRGALLLGGIAGGALTIGLKSAVDAASRAEQSIGGVQAVFKGYAKSVIADSKEADRALGLSANAYRELATIIGSQLKNAGVPMEQLAAKTDDLIRMGADLAAQFGGSTQEAVQALSSALRGELDPIERYGISLNDAALKAEAAALGLEVMGGTLTNTQRAMAVMSLVTKQGADAVGAFGREQDTAAGRAARAAAQWENLKAAIGDALLPAWSALMDLLGTTVIPLLGDVVSIGADVLGFFTALPGPVQATAVAMGAFLAFHGPLKAMLTTLQVQAVLGATGLLEVALSADRAKGAIAGLAATGATLASAFVLLKVINDFVEFTNAGDDARAMVDSLDDSLAGLEGPAQIDANRAAIERLRDELEKYQAIIDADANQNWFDKWIWQNPFEDLSDIQDAQEAVQILQDKIASLEAESSAASGTVPLLGTALAAAGAQAGVYAAELEGAASAADEAKQATDRFKLSLDILTGATVTMIQIESAFQAAVAEAEGALEGMNGTVLDGAGNLNLQSEAGRTAADVLLGVRDSGNQLIATMIQQGATAEDVMVADANLRASFIRSAEQMGISRQAAEDLADQILGIPSERETKIEADTAAASRDIAGIQGQLDGLQDKTVTIKTVYTQSGSFSGNTRDMTPGLAFGGPVPGDSPHDRADNVPIMATAGEFMHSRPAVRKYGMGFMSAVNEGRFPVELARRYADGGPIISINLDRTGLAGAMEAYANAKDSTRYVAGYATPAGGGSLGSSYQSLFAAIRAAFPQARLNSGYRPGDPGYHGRGKAADIGLTGVAGGAGNSFMAAVNQWLYDNHRGSLAELIYDGLGDNRPDVKNSRDLTYSASTQAAHRNHVHAAVYDSGGPLYPGLTLAYNGTGKTEWVSREMSGGSGSPAAPSIDYERLAAAMQQGRPVQIYTPDVPHAIRALEAHQRQQAALAPAW